MSPGKSPLMVSTSVCSSSTILTISNIYLWFNSSYELEKCDRSVSKSTVQRIEWKVLVHGKNHQKFNHFQCRLFLSRRRQTNRRSSHFLWISQRESTETSSQRSLYRVIYHPCLSTPTASTCQLSCQEAWQILLPASLVIVQEVPYSCGTP